MTWGVGIIERRLRYPNLRRELKENLEFLADENEQKRTLDYATSLDPWSWDRLNDAIEDTFVTGRPSDTNTIGIVLHDRPELDALIAVWDAIDVVLTTERETFNEFTHAVTAPSWSKVIETARAALDVLSRSDEPPRLPSRAVARDILDGIANGTIDADDASLWSSQWTDVSLRSADPILADAMWRIWFSPYSGGSRTVDRSIVSGWVNDLDHEIPDAALLATDALSHDWVRDELYAYGRAIEPRTSCDPEAVSVKLIYWHTAGLAALPESADARDKVSARVIQRLVDCGFPEQAARQMVIDFEDEAPRWKKGAVR